jgi:hypothetical protein
MEMAAYEMENEIVSHGKKNQNPDPPKGEDRPPGRATAKNQSGSLARI